MGPFAVTVLTLTVAGALVSWAVGAVYYFRCLAAAGAQDRNWLRIKATLAWPFTLGQLQGAAEGEAAVVNKAIVAFIVCVTLAIATISLSTNFTRISK